MSFRTVAMLAGIWLGGVAVALVLVALQARLLRFTSLPYPVGMLGWVRLIRAVARAAPLAALAVVAVFTVTVYVIYEAARGVFMARTH